VTAATGGRRGGGARLTAFGQELLDRYRSMEAKAGADSAAELDALEGAARTSVGPKV